MTFNHKIYNLKIFINVKICEIKLVILFISRHEINFNIILLFIQFFFMKSVILYDCIDAIFICLYRLNYMNLEFYLEALSFVKFLVYLLEFFNKVFSDW